jgi:pilus assembly protein FimV
MKRTKLLADQAEGNPATTTKRQWQATAVALAAAALLSLPSTPAQALALGRVTVQSALGEPLRADIDVPEITPDEVASLRVGIAGPEAFRAAGLDYGPAVSGISVTLQRRSDGRYFLRLTSDRPVSEPFVDVILETNWGSGRIVRDFTMLFDPPAMRQGQTPLSAQVTPSTSPAPAGRAVPAPVAPERATRPASPTAAAPATRAPATASPAAPAAPGSSDQVTVQSGETAGRIASANKPDSVSLDQMLLAMLRANPEAFIDGNVNRLRAGAVLNLPSEEQAQAIPAAEARQTLVAQSRDFNEFRRRLAEGVPTAPAAGTSREAGGRVQAQVEEKRPAAAAPDKLTLSKGAVQGRGGAEDKVAQSRAAQDANNRVAELNRNISELNKLTGAVPGATAPAAGASAPTTSATASARPASGPALPSVAIPAGSTAAAQAPAAATAASAPAATASAPVTAAAIPASAPAATAAQAAASAPAAAAAVSPASAPSTEATAPAAAPASAPAAAAPKRPAAPPPAIEEPSLFDELLANPAIPAALGGVLALLLGLGAWRARQRRKSAQVDSSFLESRLQPDSFFGASGGQRVDTAEGAPTGSSMVYSPSQLDAAGDVDPVAEADVYLAYGRDLQAEEILKEALRTNPQRIAIHSKLLEIYAKRRDAKAFEQLAGEAYGLTNGVGPEWSHICELGLDLDPSNPMYQPGGQPSGNAPLTAATAVATAGVAAAVASARPAPASAPVADSGPASVDLDLDFSLDDSSPAAKPVAAPAAALQPAAEPALNMDFGSVSASAPSEPAAMQFEAPSLTLPDNGLSFDTTEPAGLSKAPAPAPVASAAPAAPAADNGMIEFDLGSLSLDLPSSSAPESQAPVSLGTDSLSTAGLEVVTNDGEDPLATKLALAQEFNAIGDADGARSLAQEVIAEASGDLKSKAQKFLAEIG